MSSDNQFIQKTFYETMIETDGNSHPVQVLGEAYNNEQQKDLPDLDAIRFAQGEVYFQSKDYEAAIFKWENIAGELHPWAQKNTADAYYEVGLLSNAEDIYKTIITDDPTLKAEAGLQLFSLYIERNKLELADKEIKRVVAFNPDYPNVTDIARAFFEEQRDWDSAVGLAVNEAIRTEGLHWFDILKSYVDKGFTKPLAPSYFTESLSVLNGLDSKRFEQLVVSLWESYKNQEVYFTWVKNVNQLMLDMEAGRSANWNDLSALYQAAYMDLIDGKELLKKIEPIVPDLLTNWVRITDSEHALFASASALAWNEMFPGTISSVTVQEAEELIYHSKNKTFGMEEGIELFSKIVEWAEMQGTSVGYRLEWIVSELADLRKRHLLIAGSHTNGKAAVVNALLGGDLVEDAYTTPVMFKDHERFEISEVTDSEIRELADLAAYRETIEGHRQTEGTFIEFKMPNPFLYENSLAIIDTPGINSSNHGKNELSRYLNLADCLLFVLDAGTPFTTKEHELLVQLREQAPQIPIHFILNKMDTIDSDQEASRVVDQTWSRINDLFPNAKVFAFSADYESKQQLHALAQFINETFNTGGVKEERTEKLLYFIRKTITSLLQKRIEKENGLIESVKWNEDMAVKLNGAINQLGDIESEKAKTIKKSFSKMKEEIRHELASKVPDLLRECSELITEESDFRRIHLELNEEMNSRIQDYIQLTLLPKFHLSLQEWISMARDEFTESQNHLDDMGDGFNSLYGEQHLILACDFKVLDDWRRDADRMTSGVHMEDVNILLRFTPSQFLLKSAGKLFGGLSQNKAMLHNKYKTFVETEDYDETTDLVTNRFLKQFELFENSLERDVTIFFKNPLNLLNQAVEESRIGISEGKAALEAMRANPETYRDPLTLFEVKLRQQEWATIAGKRMHTPQQTHG